MINHIFENRFDFRCNYWNLQVNVGFDKKKKIKNKSRIPINIHMINVFSVNSIQNWQYIFWADSLIKPKSIKKNENRKNNNNNKCWIKFLQYMCVCVFIATWHVWFVYEKKQIFCVFTEHVKNDLYVVVTYNWIYYFVVWFISMRKWHATIK